MAYKTIPWPNVPGVGPAYSAQDWQQMQRTFGGPGSNGANSGVIWTTGFPLRALASDPASMTVNVGPGSAFVNGLWANSDALVPLTLNAADPTYGRIDLVVLRSDANNKTAVVALKTGTPDPSPTPPALDQTGSPYYEIPLAQIEVGAGVTVVHDGNITDTRRFHNAAADMQVMPAITDVAVTRGQPVVWKSSRYPNDPYGEGLLVVSTELDISVYDQPLAGIALEDAAAGAWVPILTRGIYRLPTEKIINTYDLVGVQKVTGGPDTLGSHVVKLRPDQLSNSYAANRQILGMALSWVRVPPGEVWVYVNPAAYYDLPRLYSFSPLPGTNATTNSTTYVDLPLLGGSIQARTNNLDVTVQGCLSNGGAGNTTYLGLNINGIDWNDLWAGANGANYRTPVLMRLMVGMVETVPLSSNLITVQVRWRVSAGTSTFYNVSGEVPPILTLKEAQVNDLPWA